jgi:single-stranded DNA-binding protein
MNSCLFTGYLTEDPIITKMDGVTLAEFILVVYSYRKAKSTGEKTKLATHIYCEAWHTGAETIAKFANKGTKITINASARQVEKNDDRIVFRINEFDICNIENRE